MKGVCVMRRITRALGLGSAVFALALALPAQAQDASCSQNIHSLLGEAQAKSGDVLKQCAAKQGVGVSGTPVLLAAEGSSQIADTIGGVARESASTAESMARGNASAQELAAMRVELDALISSFRLPTTR